MTDTVYVRSVTERRTSRGPVWDIDARIAHGDRLLRLETTHDLSAALAERSAVIRRPVWWARGYMSNRSWSRRGS